MPENDQQSPEKPTPVRRKLSRKKKMLFSLMVLCIAGLAALTILEIVVRIAKPQALAPPLFTMRPWGASIRPNLDNVRVQSDARDLYHVSTDASGLRKQPPLSGSSETSEPKRVMILGDSYVFGVGVEDNQTFAAVTQKRLNDANDASTFEVINASAPGWGTQNQLAFWQEVGRAMEPDVVVVAFYQNDLEDNLRAPLYLQSSKGLVRNADYPGADALGRPGITQWIPFYGWLCRHSHLVNLLRKAVAQAEKSKPLEKPTVQKPGVGKRASPEAPSVDLSRYSGKQYLYDRFMLYEALMDKLLTDIRSTGAEVIVLVLAGPSETGPKMSVRYNEASRLARQWASENPGVCALAVGEALREIQDAAFLEVDRHLSVRGNRLVAELLTDKVRSLFEKNSE